MERQIEILKAKLAAPKKKNQQHMDLIVSHIETTKEGKAHFENVRYTFPPHEDLTTAFKALGVHVGALTEQLNKDGNVDEENIRARGFTIRGEDEKEGVTLTGQRELSDGRSITLNTPFRTWGVLEAYDGSSELDAAVTKCKEEVHQYLFDGKHAADLQGELFPADEEDEEEQAA